MPSRVDPLHALRLERRALRAERDRVSQWRRVVHARMDLAVAAAAPPGPLGEDVAFLLPLDVCLQVPGPDELHHALPGTDVAREVGLLPGLRALDARLALYAQGVEHALAGATSHLVEQVATDPDAVVRTRTGLSEAH